MKLKVLSGSLYQLLAAVSDYHQSLYEENQEKLKKDRPILVKLSKSVKSNEISSDLLMQSLENLMRSHQRADIHFHFELDDYLTIDQFCQKLSSLYDNVFNQFKAQLKLKRSKEIFISDEDDKPYGLKRSIKIIEQIFSNIADILNQMLERKDSPAHGAALEIFAQIMVALNNLGYEITVDKKGKINLTVDIPQLFKKLKVLTSEDIKDYEELISSKLSPAKLQNYVSSTSQQDSSPTYTWIKDRLIRLPKCESHDDLPFAVIDKLLYETNRHKDWSEDPCLTLNRIVKKLMPELGNKRSVMQDALSQHEADMHTHFGEFESEDSDSEEERQFMAKSKSAKANKIQKSSTILSRVLPKPGTYKSRMKSVSKPPSPNRKRNPVIHRDDEFDRRTAKSDLKKLNARLQSGKPIDQDFLESIETEFVVAQYRGIHYTLTSWDADARRTHRDLPEINKPQFSSSVFIAAGVSTYREYLRLLKESKEFLLTITETAIELQHKLQALQHTQPVTYEGRAYISPFHLLQYWYSSNYDGYQERVKKRLDVEDPIFFQYLLNEHRPFLSTADLPQHALWYAYGIKLYEGHEHERLRPRWKKDGKAERPYSGKVYLSLHPLSDYSDLSPSHLTSLFVYGLLPLDNLVAAERETSFLGYLPKDRVAYHYKAKYPSFKGNYKKIFEYKYGIDESMYKVIKAGFKAHAPHSSERRQLIRILGEYLCAYHEVRLIDKAQRIASKKDQVLIYRTEDGLFDLYHPDTPSTRVNRLNPFIMARRNLYQEIGDLNKGNKVKTITRDSFFTKLRGHYKNLEIDGSKDLDYLSSIDSEKYRFFDSKNKNSGLPSSNEIAYIPLPTNDFK